VAGELPSATFSTCLKPLVTRLVYNLIFLQQFPCVYMP